MSSKSKRRCFVLLAVVVPLCLGCHSPEPPPRPQNRWLISEDNTLAFANNVHPSELNAAMDDGEPFLVLFLPESDPTTDLVDGNLRELTLRQESQPIGRRVYVIRFVYAISAPPSLNLLFSRSNFQVSKEPELVMFEGEAMTGRSGYFSDLNKAADRLMPQNAVSEHDG
ncbi:MAG: hypothetical protein AAFX06_28480 [Planctomycetota bacterium]